jgi:hypothetical protein
MIPLPNLYAASVAAVCHFTLNLKTEVWQAHGIRCIKRARRHWVHILHQDDIVLPGFYDHLRKGAEQSDAGTIFCRYGVANSKGHWMGISELHRESAGLLDNRHARIIVQQLIRCSALAVRRLVYEQGGGFCPIAEMLVERPFNTFGHLISKRFVTRVHVQKKIEVSMFFSKLFSNSAKG